MSMTAEELRRAQEEEYGAYRAVEPIDIGTARAFNVGDPVPKSTVESGAVSKDKVERVKDKSKPTTESEG